MTQAATRPTSDEVADGKTDIVAEARLQVLERGEGLNKEQVLQVLMQMGIPPKTAGQFIEMYKAINEGVVAGQEPRSPENVPVR